MHLIFAQTPTRYLSRRAWTEVKTPKKKTVIMWCIKCAVGGVAIEYYYFGDIIYDGPKVSSNQNQDIFHT